MSTQEVEVDEFAGMTSEQILNHKAKIHQQKLDFVYNSHERSSRLLQKLMDPRRDIDRECGFPLELDETMISRMRTRNGLADKVLNLYPNHCWKVTPEILETADASQMTPFEKAVEDLHGSLRIDNIPDEVEGRTTWFNDSTSSPLWNMFRRAQMLSGIGKNGYSVIVLGFNDNEDLEEPLVPKEGLKLVYATPYEESHASIASYGEDDTEKQYRRPLSYTITTDEGTTSLRSSQPNVSISSSSSFTVHSSRVIHICNSPESSDLFGRSLLEKVWNPLLGTDKLIGAGPEGYWKMAFTKLLLETMPGITKDDVDVDSLKSEIFKFENSLQGVMSFFGMKGNTVAPSVTNPGPFMDMLTDWISMAMDCPKRIFIGSERGELASSQDKQGWNEVVSGLQKDFVSPRIIAPFFDRLIWAKVLPEPSEDGYFVEWPDLNQQSGMERADVANKRAEAMTKFVSGGVGDVLMSAEDFLSREMDYSQEDVKEIMDNFEPLPKIEVEDDDSFGGPKPPVKAPITRPGQGEKTNGA